ncbi:hypothetical protein VTP01DRAFT_8148 [Rhizomucor pusillus]|uniref:uncharacterized protein n=1 Tax=Rhizomucor pusillus TaxID=4840 RepID=UPI003743A601
MIACVLLTRTRVPSRPIPIPIPALAHTLLPHASESTRLLTYTSQQKHSPPPSDRFRHLHPYRITKHPQTSHL